jgi:tetratricopeptide (TPR) repeat protein
MRIRLLTAAAAAFAASLACRPAPPSEKYELQVIPRPDLSGAEPAVVDQIEAARSELDELVAAAGAEPADLAEAHVHLGFVYLTYEFLEAADAAFSNAVRIQPDARRWVYLRGLVAKMLGRTETAIEHLSRVLEMERRAPSDPGVDGTDVEDHLVVLRLADSYLELGDRERAGRLFEQALASDPDSAVALEGLGRIAEGAGDTGRAVELFERALELQPTASALHYSLGLAYRRLGDLERAEYHLARRGEAAVALDDPVLLPVRELNRSVQLELAHANRAMVDQRYDAAAEAFRRILDREGEHLVARHGLATALLELGDSKAALEHLEEALRRAPREGEAARARKIDLLRTVAAIHAREGRDLELLESLDAVLELDPQRLEARSERGDALARLGRFAEAIEEYGRILAVRQDHPPTLLKRATARINAGQAEAGLLDFERALAAAPEEPAIRLRYADALDHLGRRQQAAAERAAAGTLAGEGAGRGDLLAAQARRQMSAGRFEEAAKTLGDLLELVPGDVPTRLELARVLGHVGRYAEAEAAFSQVLKSSPRNEEAWRGIVLATILDDRLEDAKLALREALQTFPRDSALANTLALLLATAPDAEVRHAELALDLAVRVHQTRGDVASAETLAAALAESGRFDEAVARQRWAVEKASAAGDGLELGGARLEAYLRREPWRLRSPEELAVLLAASPDGGR